MVLAIPLAGADAFASADLACQVTYRCHRLDALFSSVCHCSRRNKGLPLSSTALLAAHGSRLFNSEQCLSVWRRKSARRKQWHTEHVESINALIVQ
jgi:hypothetical protein